MGGGGGLDGRGYPLGEKKERKVLEKRGSGVWMERPEPILRRAILSRVVPHRLLCSALCTSGFKKKKEIQGF